MLGSQILYLVFFKTYFMLALRSIHLNEVEKLKEIDAALAESYKQIEMTDFSNITLDDYTIDEDEQDSQDIESLDTNP